MVRETKPNGPSRIRPAATVALVAYLHLAASGSFVEANGSAAVLGGIGRHLSVAAGLPAEYRPGTLLLRDDPDRTLYSTLVELSRRQGGRKMLRRLLDSGFITVLVSERLRPMQAGLWGPIFSEGSVVGAALRLDVMQIRGLDHDPTGVETLAHELRHQVDAARAFGNAGTYEAVYRAAASGDRTRSAQRYASRLRHQRPDLSAAEAEAWLRPHVSSLPAIPGELVAGMPERTRSDSEGATSPQRDR